MWVCSRIIGDGKDTKTAWRVAANMLDVMVKTLDYIVSDPRTGAPVATFSIFEVSDAQAPMLANDPGCYVLPHMADSDPLGFADKNAISSGFASQSCNVDLSDVSTFIGAVSKAQMLIVAQQTPGQAGLG